MIYATQSCTLKHYLKNEIWKYVRMHIHNICVLISSLLLTLYAGDILNNTIHTESLLVILQERHPEIKEDQLE